MAVEYSGWAFGTDSSGSTTAVASLSAASVGDLALVLISRYNYGAPPPDPTSVPSGWTLLGKHTAPTYYATHWLYAKLLGSGDLTTHTWTFSASYRTLARAVLYSGCDPTAPIADDTQGTYAEGYGTTIDCGSLTTSEAMVVAIGAVHESSVTFSLASWTERVDAGSADADLWHCVYDTGGAWGGGTAAPDITADPQCFYLGGFLVALAPETAPITPTSIPSAEAFGTLSIGDGSIRLVGIPSAEALGEPTLFNGVRLLPDTGVEISSLSVANKVVVVVDGSSPLVSGSATNTTVPPTYTESPREIVQILKGGDQNACNAVAALVLAARQEPRYKLMGLKVLLRHGLGIQRGQRVRVKIPRAGIDASFPVRRLEHDFKAKTTTIDVGDYHASRTTEDALVRVVMLLAQLEKESKI